MLHNNIINRDLEFKQLPNEQTDKVLKIDANYLHLNIKQKLDFSKTMWNKKKLSNPNAKIRLATMFSGIGAVEFALKRLKLSTKIIFASDNDKFVKQSYFENYKISEENWYSDVINIDGNKYKNKIDLLVGGSPCQSFSMIGKRKGFADTRGTLFYEFARVVKESQPKVFIYENVKGLTNHDKGNTFETILATFDELGYKYSHKILNAKNFGMAQHRERIFVVGFLDKSNDFDFPEPIELQHTMQDFLEDYIDSKYYLKEKGVKFVTSSKNRKKDTLKLMGI
ncbi:MAG: DNA (cytosine-5-)-methyltransferase [Sulfurovum sp.]|nr:DNA (cytosine-5-)-methyltransferase [Sulfurovum sp.]